MTALYLLGFLVTVAVGAFILYRKAKKDIDDWEKWLYSQDDEFIRDLYSRNSTLKEKGRVYILKDKPVDKDKLQ